MLDFSDQGFNIELWERLESNNTPIYLRRDRADWLVPNPAGDQLLRDLADGCRPDRAGHLHFLGRLPQSPVEPYQAQPQTLKLTELKEFWFHLTNRCNQSCRHCLFSCGPQSPGQLNLVPAKDAARQARELGCRVFALTGGEPTLHEGCSELLDLLLKDDDSHVVILSNGHDGQRLLDLCQDRPRERLHLQLSLDGLEEVHDQLRGRGAFQRLRKTLQNLAAEKRAPTLACCLTRDNYHQLDEIVAFAAAQGVTNLHLTWYFIQGRGQAEARIAGLELFPVIRRAAAKAEALGLTIDNLEALKTQVFAPPGTVHWAATSGWESLTLAPDGRIYPSPTLVSAPETGFAFAGELKRAWHESPALQRLRLVHPGQMAAAGNLLLGPGDPDQSYLQNLEFGGFDPYWFLQRQLALSLISDEARQSPDFRSSEPALLLQMGDRLESCGAHGREALVHNNCLLALSENNSLTVVKDFYRKAAAQPRLDIVNPVSYEPELMSHIPEAARFRGYGCGSPVGDAELKAGETLVDLGSGMGVECFIAARLLGREGRAIGIDMLEPMLSKARAQQNTVAANLGYNNLDFRFGYLEKLPLEDNSVDVVISNCVLNLSSNKRRVYREIIRVLKPGGRLLISDVVCLSEPDPAIRNDEALRGECIAGALTINHLFGLLRETGLIDARLHKLFPYREVEGQLFHSLTYSARKPRKQNENDESTLVINRGPARNLETASGRRLPVGQALTLPAAEIADFGDELYRIDKFGIVENVAFEMTCDCGIAPEARPGAHPDIHDETPASAAVTGASPSAAQTESKQAVNCMVCGAQLQYFTVEEERECHYCGRRLPADAVCEKGHFVCDQCHLEDGVAAIEHLCLSSRETRLGRLLKDIRRHPAIPVHGPEHHALMPGIILTAYRNLGGKITDEQIKAGIKRGAKLPGGACGFLGVCGAAMGVGTAFAMILQATPMQAAARRLSQQATHACLGRVTAFEAARCCQRESWICLEEAARLSHELLPIPLETGAPPLCGQSGRNPTCIKDECPLWPAKRRQNG